MRREVVWSAWDGSGTEHLLLAVADAGAVADGLGVGVAGGWPFRVRYEVRCDAGWRARAVRVYAPVPDPSTPAVDLSPDVRRELPPQKVHDASSPLRPLR